MFFEVYQYGIITNISCSMDITTGILLKLNEIERTIWKMQALIDEFDAQSDSDNINHDTSGIKKHGKYF